MGMVALQPLLVLLVLGEAASALLIKPDDPALRWSGRAVRHADGTRTADWVPHPTPTRSSVAV